MSRTPALQFLSTFPFTPDRVITHFARPPEVPCDIVHNQPIHPTDGPNAPEIMKQLSFISPTAGTPAAYTIKMLPNETLSFYGAVRIYMISGTIQIGGYLHSSTASPCSAPLSDCMISLNRFSPPLSIPMDNYIDILSPSWNNNQTYSIHALPPPPTQQAHPSHIPSFVSFALLPVTSPINIDVHPDCRTQTYYNHPKINKSESLLPPLRHLVYFESTLIQASVQDLISQLSDDLAHHQQPTDHKLVKSLMSHLDRVPIMPEALQLAMDVLHRLNPLHLPHQQPDVSEPQYAYYQTLSTIPQFHARARHTQIDNYLSSPLRTMGFSNFFPLLCSRSLDHCGRPRDFAHIGCGRSWKATMRSVEAVFRAYEPKWLVINQFRYNTFQFREGKRSIAPKPPTILVIGNRNQGKSTYIQLLINQLLNTFPAVGLLESDIGQTETMPAGLVSTVTFTKPILSPPYLHPIFPPETTFVFGNNTLESDPKSYLTALKSSYLSWIDHLTTTHMLQSGGKTTSVPSPFIPLVVNTAGWVTGVGKTIITHIREVVQPEIVVELNDNLHRYIAVNYGVSTPVPQDVVEQVCYNRTDNVTDTSIPSLLRHVSSIVYDSTVHTPEQSSLGGVNSNIPVKGNQLMQKPTQPPPQQQQQQQQQRSQTSSPQSHPYLASHLQQLSVGWLLSKDYASVTDPDTTGADPSGDGVSLTASELTTLATSFPFQSGNTSQLNLLTTSAVPPSPLSPATSKPKRTEPTTRHSKHTHPKPYRQPFIPKTDAFLRYTGHLDVGYQSTTPWCTVSPSRLSTIEKSVQQLRSTFAGIDHWASIRAQYLKGALNAITIAGAKNSKRANPSAIRSDLKQHLVRARSLYDGLQSRVDDHGDCILYRSRQSDASSPSLSTDSHNPPSSTPITPSKAAVSTLHHGQEPSIDVNTSELFTPGKPRGAICFDTRTNHGIVDCDTFHGYLTATPPNKRTIRDISSFICRQPPLSVDPVVFIIPRYTLDLGKIPASNPQHTIRPLGLHTFHSRDGQTVFSLQTFSFYGFPFTLSRYPVMMTLPTDTIPDHLLHPLQLVSSSDPQSIPAKCFSIDAFTQSQQRTILLIARPPKDPSAVSLISQHVSLLRLSPIPSVHLPLDLLVDTIGISTTGFTSLAYDILFPVHPQVQAQSQQGQQPSPPVGDHSVAHEHQLSVDSFESIIHPIGPPANIPASEIRLLSLLSFFVSPNYTMYAHVLTPLRISYWRKHHQTFHKACKRAGLMSRYADTTALLSPVLIPLIYHQEKLFQLTKAQQQASMNIMHSSYCLLTAVPYAVPFDCIQVCSIPQLYQAFLTPRHQHHDNNSNRHQQSNQPRQQHHSPSLRFGISLTSSVIKTITGCVVALCSTSPLGHNISPFTSNHPALENVHPLPYHLSSYATPPTCMGYGIIHSASLTGVADDLKTPPPSSSSSHNPPNKPSGTLYVITPIPPSLTCLVDLVVILSPSIALLPPNVLHLAGYSSHTPYLTSNTFSPNPPQAKGGVEMKSKNSLQRKGTVSFTAFQESRQKHN